MGIKVIRDVDSDLKKMGVVKWTKRDFELLDIFDTVLDNSSACSDWTDVCPAEVVAALDEDLLLSDDESSSAEENTLNNQSNCGSVDLNQNIDLSGAVDEVKSQRSRSRSGSEASFSDSSTSEEEGELGATTAEVEELERLARLNDSSELEEDLLERGSNEEEREVEEFEKLASLETSSDDENDQTGTNTETFHANEQFQVSDTVRSNEGCNDAFCSSTVANPPDKYWSNLDNSLSSSGEESEDEELDEFALQLELEVNEEHNIEEPVCSDTIGHSGCIEDFVAHADQLEQRIGLTSEESGDVDAPEDSEDSDVESLPDPEHCAPSADNAEGSQEGEVGEGEVGEGEVGEVGETDSDERQQVLAALAEAKAVRVTRGDEPERKEVSAAGLSLNLHFSSIVTSYFATEEEKAKFESIETSRKEAKELARAQFEATQLTGTQVAPMSSRRATRGGLRWCYKKQLKEFLDEMQESGEACIGQGSVEEGVVEEGFWSRKNPGRGTKRKRFQHYKDFITLKGTKYDTETLAALLSPGSKCFHNLLQLSSDIAAGQTGSQCSSGTEVAIESRSRSRSDSGEHASAVHQESDFDEDGELGHLGGDDKDTSRDSGCGHPDIRLKSLDSSMPVFI